MGQRTGDRVIAGMLVVLAVAMFVATTEFPPPGQPNDPGTAAFPRIVAVLLGLLALGLLVRPDKGSLLPSRDRLPRVVAIMALTAAYGILLPTLGFLAVTTAFMVVALLIMGVRRPVPLLLVTLGVTFGLYYLFAEGLSVFLPSGFVEELLP